MDKWGFYWVIIVALISLQGFLKPRFFLLLLPLTSIWATSTYLFIDISVLKIVLVSFFTFTLLVGFPKELTLLPTKTLVVFFVLYAALYSLFMAFNVPASDLVNVVYSEVQKPPIRGILSTFLFLVAIFSLLMPFWIVDRLKFFSLLVRLSCMVALIAAIIGLTEMVVNLFTPAFNGVFAFLTKGIIIESSGFTGLRPSPFVYEPRYFGVAMGYSMMLLVLCRLYPIPFIPKFILQPWIIVFFVAMLMASASVSAIVGTIAGSVAVGVWHARQQGNNILKLLKPYLLVAVVFLFLLLNSDILIDRFTYYLERMGLIDLGLSAFVDQAQGSLSTTAFVVWLLDQPQNLLFGVGLGNGTYYAYDYISLDTGFHEHGFMNSRVGIIDLISGIGLVGAAALLAIWYRWLKFLGNHKYQYNLKYRNYINITRGMIIFLICSGMFNENYPLVWFYFGVGFSFIFSLCGLRTKFAFSSRLSPKEINS
ncbi:MAG: hypothetical protein RQ866_00615 [Bacteroidales bacterium]|nr:hypothetical protein [Bacteroidales bacterium]